MSRKIKILLAKIGLDVHNRGIITVAKILCDAGIEVIYIGNAFPQEIISTAIQEDVDMIGVSSLGGAHITLGKLLLEEAEKEELRNSMIFLMGGVFSPLDTETLFEIGFNAVFPVGSTSDQIIDIINNLAAN